MTIYDTRPGYAMMDVDAARSKASELRAEADRWEQEANSHHCPSNDEDGSHRGCASRLAQLRNNAALNRQLADTYDDQANKMELAANFGWRATEFRDQFVRVANPDGTTARWVIDLSELDSADELLEFRGALGETFPTARLEELFTRVAADKAGIDYDNWNPAAGYYVNQEIVDAVYSYYGDAFRSDPQRFIWEGMASLMAPSFVAAMADLAAARKAGTVGITSLPLGMGLAAVLDPAVLSAGPVGVENLTYFETRLLSMQKEIFIDMGAKREAFLYGGANEVESLTRGANPNDPFLNETVGAFRALENGGDKYEAAETLLRREQMYIIRDDWDDIRGHKPLGYPFTVTMTGIGKPALPGARTYGEVFPMEVGNLSVAEQRWALIEADTLPAYLDLHQNNLDEAIRLTSQSATARSEPYRFTPGD